MYKKYITKKGKKLGPYYYDSIRMNNGKVKSIYLGSDLKKANQKSKVLKTESSKAVHKRSSATLKISLNPKLNIQSIRNQQLHMKDRFFLSSVLLVMLVGFMYFGGILNVGYGNEITGGVTQFKTFSDMARESFERGNGLTGQAVSNKLTGDAIFFEKEIILEDKEEISLLIDESSEYSLNFEGVGKLKSLKFSGRLASFDEGVAKIFLSDINSGDTYLVYDSEASDEGFFESMSITGNVVLEEEIEIKNYKELGSLLTGFNIINSKGKTVKYESFNGSNNTTIIGLNELVEIKFPQKEGWIAYEEYSSRGLIEPANISFERVFGFDFSGLNFTLFNETNTSFSARSEGDLLYGCAYWDFEFGICLTDWEYLFDINNSENYSTNLTSEVMAFAEGVFDIREFKAYVEKETEIEVEEEKEDFLIDLLDLMNVTNYTIDSFESNCEDTCKLKNVLSNNFILKFYVKNSVLDLNLMETEYVTLEGINYSLKIWDGVGTVLLGNETSPKAEVVLNNFTADVVTNVTGNSTEETVQYGAVIGKPVKWKKKIMLDVAQKNVEFELPDTAQNIILNKVVNGKLKPVDSAALDEMNGTIINLTSGSSDDGFAKGIINSITGNFITGMVVSETSMMDVSPLQALNETNANLEVDTVKVDDIVETIEVEYETPGPKLEVENKTNGFRVVLKSSMNYTNILAFLDIPDTPMNKVRLFQIAKDNITGREYRVPHNYTLYGSNNSGFVNYIEWVIPTSQDDTFDIQTEINATAAIHLDENFTYINDIFKEVKFVDGLWSESIWKDEYVRVTFERNLTNGRMIDVLARSNGTLSYFEIYEANTTNLVGKSAVVDHPEVQYITVDGLSKPTDIFDFKFMNIIGSEEDYLQCLNLSYGACDLDPYDGCYKEVEEDCYSPIYDVNRSSYMEFDFIHDDVINSTQADGMIAYVEVSVASPRYRLWNESNDFEAEQSALATGTDTVDNIAWVVLRGGHERNEMILGVQDANEDINVQVYDANVGSWNNLTEVTATAEIENQRQFDIAYEDVSGDALIVYENSNAPDSVVAYRVWDGTSLTSESTFTTGLVSGEILWVKLYPKPNSDDIMVLIHNDINDLYAVLWNGTDLDPNSELVANITTSGINQHFDFAWEHSSGEGFMLYGVGTNLNVYIRKYEGGTWSDEQSFALGSYPSQISLCSEESSDYIGITVHDAHSDLNLGVWDGSSLLAGAPSEDAFVEASGVYNKNNDCFWMNSTTMVSGFIDNAALFIDWVTYSKTGGWSHAALQTSTFTTSSFATDDIEAFDYVKHPTTQEAMAFAIDNLEDLTTIRWDGVTVTVPPHSLLEATTQVNQAHTQDADFDWFRYDPVPNVTQVNVNETSATQNSVVRINATVVDNVAVDVVKANVTLPNSTVNEIILTDIDLDTNFTFEFTATDTTGTYTVLIIANDTSTHQNINNTGTTTFDITGGAANTHPNATITALINTTNYTEVGNIVLTSTVTDGESSTFEVRIYGSGGQTKTDVSYSDILYQNLTWQNATSLTYNWTAPVLVQTSNYLLLAHFDNNTRYSETAKLVYDFANSDGEQNGTIQNGASVNSSGGMLGGSFFSTAAGVSDSVNFGDQDNWINESNISYSFWAKPAIITGAHGIFEKRSVNPAGAGLAIRQVAETLTLKIDGTTVTVASAFALDEWTHIVVSFNESNQVSIYRNGVFNTSETFTSLTTNNLDALIGSGRGTFDSADYPFNGNIDEFAIINKSLNASEVLDLYRLPSGDNSWFVEVNDSELSNESASWMLTMDRKPEINSLSIGPTGVNRTTGINCTFTPLDDADSTLDVTIKYYNGTNLFATNTPTGLTSGVEYTDNISAFTYNHFENYSCNVTTIDTRSSVSDQENSSYIFIENYEPGTSTLNGPDESTTHIIRTPTFNWTPSDTFNRLPNVGNTSCVSEGNFFCQGRTSDVDQDLVNYTVNISCFVVAGGTCDDEREYLVVENSTNCDANANGYLDNEDNCTFTLSTDLTRFYDDNNFYRWTIKSKDSYAQQAVLPTVFNYNLSIYIALDLLDSNVDFGSLGVGVRAETSGCNLATQTPTPCPIWIENSGNVKADVNITGPTVAFWDTQSLPHSIDYFSVKVGDGTEGTSFDATASNITYRIMPAAGVSEKFINNLSKDDSSDEARIDFNISVPVGELAGAKGLVLELTTWYGEINGA